MDDFVYMFFEFSPDDVAQGFFTINIDDQVSDGVPGPGAGNLETAGTRDRYTFNAMPGQQVYIDLQGFTNAAGGAGFKVNDSMGAVIADTCVGCAVPSAKSLVRGGAYTIVVNERRSNNIGTYRFQVREQ